jgi:uncharacterized membrane protein YgcG
MAGLKDVPGVNKDGSDDSYYQVGSIGFFMGVIFTILIAWGFSKMNGNPNIPNFNAYGITGVFKYLPHSILLFGIFADMFTQTQHGVYAISTLIGIISMFVTHAADAGFQQIPLVNAMMTYLAGGLARLWPFPRTGGNLDAAEQEEDTRNGEMEGFGAINTLGGIRPKLFSQSTATMSTICFYFIFDAFMPVKNNYRVDVGGTAPFILFLLMAIAHSMVMDQPGVRTFLSIILGIGMGGIAYVTVMKANPSFLLSSGASGNGGSGSSGVGTSGSGGSGGSGGSSGSAETCDA